MKKKIIIILVVAVVLTIISVYAYSRDNIRFKLSYEYANYTEYNGKKIKVNIPFDNRIKYVNAKELIDILKNGTGIVYFGYSTCPWCRNIVPILIDTVVENDLKIIYYVDIHNIDLNSIKNELYDILNPYLREDEDGNKRMAVPDVYAIKKGKIKGHHIGTVLSYKDPTKGMNKKQKAELKEIYNNLIKEIK